MENRLLYAVVETTVLIISIIVTIIAWCLSAA
jgi:hypothetical protein